MQIKPIIKYLDEVDSTNNFLQQWIKEENVPERSAVVAARQTQGRGQMGNKWISATGKNLTFSFVLYPHFIPVNEQFVISEIAALSVKETLSRYVENIRIKWPNDIYCADRKICGMLIENNLTGKQIDSTLIGIGINVNQNEFPADANNPVSLFQLINKEVKPDSLLDVFFPLFDANYDEISSEQGKKRVHEAYMNNLYRSKGYHNFYDKKEMKTIRASISSVTSSGLLILLTEDGEERSYFFKEIEYIK